MANRRRPTEHSIKEASPRREVTLSVLCVIVVAGVARSVLLHNTHGASCRVRPRDTRQSTRGLTCWLHGWFYPNRSASSLAPSPARTAYPHAINTNDGARAGRFVDRSGQGETSDARIRRRNAVAPHHEPMAGDGYKHTRLRGKQSPTPNARAPTEKVRSCRNLEK